MAGKTEKKKSDSSSTKKVYEKSRVYEIQSHIHDADGNPIFTPEMVERYLQLDEDIIVRSCWVLHDKDKYIKEDLIERYVSAKVIDGGMEQDTGIDVDATDEETSDNDIVDAECVVHEKLDIQMNETLEDVPIKIGEKKPAHIHLAVEFRNPIHKKALRHRLAQVTGLNEFNGFEYVRLPEHHYNQFMGIAAYFTHEDKVQQDLGKHRYSDSEIHCKSQPNKKFVYRVEVDNYFKRRNQMRISRLGKTGFMELIESVEQGTITPKQIRDEFGYGFYQMNEQKIKRARLEYYKNKYAMQPRMNIFIDGGTGLGKSTLASMIAANLFPELTEDEAYYETGQAGVRFDNYENQPVIIWNDVRGEKLSKEFGTNEVLNLTETNPKKRNYNIKYGGVILTNTVNIFTSIEDHASFIRYLAGVKDADNMDASPKTKMENLHQFYRRIQIIIHVYERSIEIWKYDKGHGKKVSEEERLPYVLDNCISIQGENLDEEMVLMNLADINRIYSGEAKREIARQITAPIKKLYEQMSEESGMVDDIMLIPTIKVTSAEEKKSLDEEYSGDYERFKNISQKSDDKIKEEIYDWAPIAWLALAMEKLGLSEDEIIERMEKYADIDDVLEVLLKVFKERKTKEYFDKCAVYIRDKGIRANNSFYIELQRLGYEEGIIDNADGLVEYIKRGLKKQVR